MGNYLPRMKERTALPITLGMIAVLVALMLSGCGRAASTAQWVRETPEQTERLTLKQDKDATKQATARLGVDRETDDPFIEMGAGSEERPSPEEIAAQSANDPALMVVGLGGLLILLGIVALAAKAWFPLLPTTAGTYSLIAGGGLIAAGLIFPAIPAWTWTLVIVGGAAVGAFLIVPGVMANRSAEKKANGSGNSSSPSPG